MPVWEYKRLPLASERAWEDAGFMNVRVGAVGGVSKEISKRYEKKLEIRYQYHSCKQSCACLWREVLKPVKTQGDVVVPSEHVMIRKNVQFQEVVSTRTPRKVVDIQTDAFVYVAGDLSGCSHFPATEINHGFIGRVPEDGLAYCYETLAVTAKGIKIIPTKRVTYGLSGR